jgi:hypothetical protein
MKTIVCMWGRGNQGKTEVIRKLAEKFAKKYETTENVPCTGDVSLMVTVNGKKCGLESCGDPDTSLFERLKEWAKKSCDVIVCASRSRGSTADAVALIAEKYHYRIIWTTPYLSDDNLEQLNCLKAEHLSDLLLQMKLFP